MLHTTAALTASAVSTSATSTPQPRLVKAAHEFEAQMMKELMKPMTSSDSLTGDDADSGGDSGSGGAMGQYASEALGRALSERGGFGIANRIVQDLSHQGNQKVTTQVTGNVHGDTVISTLK
jgi:Rod binding domain-containing protein